MTGRIIICSLLFSLHAAGQEQEVIDSVRPQESAPTTFMGRLHQVQQYLDNKARSSVDPHYIEVPDKPWRVILRYKETAVDVDYDNSLVEPGSQNRVDFNMRFQPPASASIGFWVGYRGTGISYSYSLAKNAGRYFSFSSTGAKYGINFRLRRFNTDEVSASFKIIENGDVTKSLESSGHMPAPVWIRSAYLNAYYVFNGRRYSQAAAYN